MSAVPRGRVRGGTEDVEFVRAPVYFRRCHGRGTRHSDRGRHRSRRLECQILREDISLQFAERRSRIETQLRREILASGPQYGERVALAATAIVRRREQPRRLFAARLLAH